MRKGGGKSKGGGFEREVCKHLSRWVSRGTREDLYWRSAMSGGRATLGAKKGQDLRFQAGDICAVHPMGHVLTDYWYIECKFVRKLNLRAFICGTGGPMQQYWKVAEREALVHKRIPMMVAKENNGLTLVVVPRDSAAWYEWAHASTLALVVKQDAAVLSFPDMLEQPFTASHRRIRARS